MLLNACDVKHKKPECILDVFSVDTDVFILLTGLFPCLPRSTSIIRKKGERFSVKDSYTKLGNDKADALIGWYAFRGTDCTGSFAGKGVSTHMKAFLESDDDILSAFAQFGLHRQLPECVFSQMERYFCILYGTDCRSNSTLKHLRWTLFAQKGKEGQQLPPTTGALVPHTCRAHYRYMALMWKSSMLPLPQIPPPTDYYWTQEEDSLKPVCCMYAPAPEDLLKLHKCNCKTGCQRKSCTCLMKHNLVAFFKGGVGHFKRKFQVEGDNAHHNLFWYQKTKLITLSCGIQISAVCSFVSSQSTRVTDGRTDRETELRSPRPR